MRFKENLVDVTECITWTKTNRYEENKRNINNIKSTPQLLSFNIWVH